MSRPTTEGLTEREAQIMEIVWRLGEATAEQVREALPGTPHDSSVRTVMRALESKGYLTHEKRGKAYVHRPAIERGKAQKLALRGVLSRFFAGSAADLAMSLVEDESLTPEQWEALRRKALSQPNNDSNQGGTTS